MTSQIKSPEYKELLPYVLNKEIGQIMLHSEIADVMILKYGTNKYRTQLRRVNAALLKYNRQIVSIKGEGYKIIGNNGMVEMALKMAEKSKGRSKAAMEILENIDSNKLTEENKLKYNLIVMKVTQLYASLAGGLIEAKIIKKSIRQINTN